ncbi:hypothetical protein GCM10022252_22460 [Streptosporangium oxazolinicum]|uniref:Uncharacterized protein n=1 Tax=Streptosporangium oxazolinicum TaxID=909287 RepID=A0ABP8AQY7_9ACTN
MKKIKAGLLALMVAGLLGASATPASAVELHDQATKPDCDSHWMDPGE